MFLQKYLYRKILKYKIQKQKIKGSMKSNSLTLFTSYTQKTTSIDSNVTLRIFFFVMCRELFEC